MHSTEQITEIPFFLEGEWEGKGDFSSHDGKKSDFVDLTNITKIKPNVYQVDTKILTSDLSFTIHQEVGYIQLFAEPNSEIVKVEYLTTQPQGVAEISTGEMNKNSPNSLTLKSIQRPCTPSYKLKFYSNTRIYQQKNKNVITFEFLMAEEKDKDQSYHCFTTFYSKSYLNQFKIDLNSTIRNIDCEKAFQKLNEQEKNYSYYFTRASWEGAKICYFQRSFESPALLYLFQKIFNNQTVKEIKTLLKTQCKFSDHQVQQLYVYIAAILQNCGNYRSFGDTKFIPDIPKKMLLSFIKSTKAYQTNQKEFDEIWEKIELELYEFEQPYGQIGMNQEGLSSYYSYNITKEQAESINKFMESIDVSPLNSRIVKVGENQFQIRIASAEVNQEKQPKAKDYDFQEKKVKVVYGDFSPFLKQVVVNLQQALKYVANENQKNMIEQYIEHFQYGDIQVHKESQKYWVKDKGPIVETNIGFIESYLDPLTVRAEWEGFVSVVDKEKSALLQKLVDNAPNFIQKLPWGKTFEVDEFQKPDFTSLDVLSFACSGTPIGINIPNYDDIKENFGFKNVDLGNAYGKINKDKIQFTPSDMLDAYVANEEKALFVIVALHELLGHGTGKLFKKDKEGKFNFDKDNTINPLTGQKVQTFYDVNQTWHSVFGGTSSGYEECRADSVACYLSCYDEILEILLPNTTKQQRDDILVAIWYEMVYGGVRGLKCYIADSQSWGQAHMQASFAILKVLMEADDKFIQFEEVEKDGKPYCYIHFDHTKIKTVGFQAIGKFLQHLQIYRSTADAQAGLAYFENYSKVNEQLLRIRDIVLKNALPRSIELQHDVERLNSGEIKYVKFNESIEGIIESQIFHYGKDQSKVDELYNEWAKDINLFKNQNKTQKL